jgi:hypothetical protein
MLISPEGDTRRRRHAHTDCVLAARKAGKLPLHEEWRRLQPDTGMRGSWPRRLLQRLRARAGAGGDTTP